MDAIRSALASGAGVVGVRLSPPPSVTPMRWYIGAAQFHYLGLHAPHVQQSPWGACMAFDLSIVDALGLRFEAKLGRLGQGFESGDDSSFVSEMRRNGARVDFLDRGDVYHHVQPQRMRLTTVLRRAWWQGRSEVRRGQARAGVQKEARRMLGAADPLLKRFSLFVIYGGAVVCGVAYEWLRRDRRA